jgi:ornithine cyclodeaminase/alanine dehydrogenase-like protein (mu-crystallin family)
MPGTLLLSRADVERLLTPDLCIEAIEDAFRRLAEGAVPPPAILRWCDRGPSSRRSAPTPKPTTR